MIKFYNYSYKNEYIHKYEYFNSFELTKLALQKK